MHELFLKRLLYWISIGTPEKFYWTKEWRETRVLALRRDKNECQHCRKKGKYRRAECVHHIKEVKHVPRLALTLSNLISLCNQCHNIEHERVGPQNIEKFIANEERW